jgi:hypothetical protein
MHDCARPNDAAAGRANHDIEGLADNHRLALRAMEPSEAEGKRAAGNSGEEASAEGCTVIAACVDVHYLVATARLPEGFGIIAVSAAATSA